MNIVENRRIFSTPLNVQWFDVLNNASTNRAYDKFLTNVNELHNIALPETKIEIKTKNLLKKSMDYQGADEIVKEKQIV